MSALPFGLRVAPGEDRDAGEDAVGTGAAATRAAMTADVVVVGASPGGIATAVRAAREGLHVLLVSLEAHLGGMLSSGIDPAAAVRRRGCAAAARGVYRRRPAGGPPAGQARQGPPPPGKATGTVEFWQGWQTRTPLLRASLDQFEKATPGVKVVDTEMLTFGGANGGREKVMATVLAGTAPDCLMLFKEMYPALSKVKGVADLNRFMTRDKLDPKLFIEADLKDRTVSGQLMALPAGNGAGTNGNSLF